MENRIQILLVEDNPGDARLIQELLRHSPFQTSVLKQANNLATAFELLQQHTFDAVLLDLGLPDSQGLDSLKKITSHNPGLPVVILTGTKDSEMAIKAMQAGAQDYLVKGDFRTESLVRVIRYAIERKQVEAELQRNRKLLYEAERVSHTGAWEWDLITDQWSVSDEWMRIHGVKNHHFSSDELITTAHPDDVPAIQESWKAMFDGADKYDIEHRIIQQDTQEVRVVQAFGRLMRNPAGNPQKLIGVARDITERKQAQEKLQFQASLLDAVEQAVIVTKLDGEIIYWNPFAEKLYGWSAEEALGRNITKVTVPQLSQEQAAEIMANLGTGQSWAGEFLVQHHDGRIFPAFVSDTPLLNAEGELFAIIGISTDITERKEAEKTLRAQEEKFKRFFNTNPSATFVWKAQDGDFILTETNEASLATTAGKAADFIGLRASAIYRDLPLMTEKLNQCYQTKETVQFEHHYKARHDNAYYWIDFKLAFMEPDTILLYSDTISERKEAEEALRRSEAALKKAQKVANVGSWIWHIPTDQLDWSDQMFEIYHIDKKDFSANWTEIRSSRIHPDDLSMIAAADQSIVNDHKPIPIEYRVIWPDGTQRVVAVEAGDLSIDEEGNALSLTGIVMDITDRKKAEDKLRRSETNLKKAQKVANVGSWIWHISTDKLEMSDQMFEIYDINRKDFNGNWAELMSMRVHPDDLENLKNANQAVVNDRNPTYNEYRLVWPDGTERFVSGSPGELTLDEHGNPLTLSGITKDITEHKKMEFALQEERNLLAQRVEERTTELRRANKEMLKALQTKDEFLANMSHELRTPLTAILGVSEILEMGVRGPLNEQQVQSIRMIYDSGEHLLNLINDILDLSKIEAGKLEIETGRVVVDDACTASLSLVKGMAHSKNLTLSYHPSDKNICIHADARRLKQILVNLLSNAVKFTQAGGHVSLNVIPNREERKLAFVVEDTGIGISQEDVEKIFQPFTQLDSSLSREYEGTGLGLALVSRLVNMHHGTVSVESNGVPGEGSRFTVTLPWHDIDSMSKTTSKQNAATNEDAQQEPGQSKLPTSEEGTLILLAEDNPANTTTMSDYLKTVGFQVINAENGEEAIQKARSYLPQLILMDIQMPIMDGIKAIRELRNDEHFKDTPIIALTALAMPGDEQRCLDAGASDYISKPVKLKELCLKIQAILNITQ